MPTYRGRDNATVRQQGVHAGERCGSPHSWPDGAPRQLANWLGQSDGPQQRRWATRHSGRCAGNAGRTPGQGVQRARAGLPRAGWMISPKRGATSSPGARWPRPGPGNAVGAAGSGATSAPGPRTRAPSRKVRDAARVSGPEPAAWAGGPERAKGGAGKARAERESRQEGDTPEQGVGPLPAGAGQGGAAGNGSAHVHHTFDPIPAGAATGRAPAGKAAGTEHGRRAPGSVGGAAGTGHAEPVTSVARNEHAAANVGDSESPGTAVRDPSMDGEGAPNGDRRPRAVFGVLRTGAMRRRASAVRSKERFWRGEAAPRRAQGRMRRASSGVRRGASRSKPRCGV